MSRYVAEFVGTFVLVFTGCGAAVLAGDQIGPLGISLAFGVALIAMVYTVGHISGCHINPAVTLGLFISNKMPRKHAPGYWISQIAGGIAAAGVVLVIARGMPGGYDPAVQGLAANGFGAHSPGHYNFAAAALTEFALTFVLVITVIGATDIDAPSGFAGIPIGPVFPTLKRLYNSRICSLVRDTGYRIRGHQPSGWYDLHARLDEDAPSRQGASPGSSCLREQEIAT